MKYIKFFIKFIIKSIITIIESVGDIVLFISQSLRFVFRPPFDINNFIYQVKNIGFSSLITSMGVAFFLGLIISLLLGVGLEALFKGAASILGGVLAYVFARELSPVFIGLFLSSRVGAAITSEIGTMKVTEQIDALETLSTNPIHYLVVPRLLAFTLSFPLVNSICFLASSIGGFLVYNLYYEVSLDEYMNSITYFVGTKDIMVGMIKSLVFGFFIAILACYHGFNTKGGAAGVGSSTVRSVVSSYLAIIVLDYFFGVIFEVIGI